MSQRDLIPRSLLSFPLAHFPSHWEDGDEDLKQLKELESSENNGLTLSEDKKNLHIEAALPGLKSEDIEVTLDKGILWIRGSKKEEVEDKEKKYYRKANSSYSFRVTLPAQIDETKEPSTSYKDGVLKLTFKKAQQSQSKKINIKRS